ncbi:HIT domain-containing protein [Patescibacteria group bacterium]|nr:HIT domain-containing protein [Patescibacteria group bacterium]MBU2632927.1 HIT domain-containing protein [Patescibacteria group bacterium]
MDKPEFRKDLVSGDWILVAGAKRGKKPIFLKKTSSAELKQGVSKCPFEDPQKNNPIPLLWYPHPKTAPSKVEDFDSWFLQVIPNKYPLLVQEKTCPVSERDGVKEKLVGVGYHEVVVTRDHFKSIDKMSLEEIQMVFKAYKERYRVLSKDPCIKYILVFHNHGEAAGASLFHPHSQIIALPVVDPDVARSLSGSNDFYKKNKKCVHCVMIESEEKDGLRIVSKNKHFIVVIPFAPRVSYETRIYPLGHASRFEDLDKELFPYLAESIKDAFVRLNKVLGNPDYNFFIHTAPVRDGDTDHYHWHIEILPRGFRWAGLELGGGIEVVAVSPEEAAENLRKVKM